MLLLLWNRHVMFGLSFVFWRILQGCCLSQPCSLSHPGKWHMSKILVDVSNILEPWPLTFDFLATSRFSFATTMIAIILFMSVVLQVSLPNFHCNWTLQQARRQCLQLVEVQEYKVQKPHVCHCAVWQSSMQTEWDAIDFQAPVPLNELSVQFKFQLFFLLEFWSKWDLGLMLKRKGSTQFAAYSFLGFPY